MTIRSVHRTVTVTLAVLCLAGFTTPALSKPKPAAEAAAPVPAKKKPVALAAFEGKKNPEVRGWVRDVVQANFELTDAEDFKVKPEPAAVAKMAKDLGVEGVILGKLEKKSLTITVYDGSDGRMLASIEIKQPPGPKLKSIITKKLPPKLFGAFGMQSPEVAAKQQAEAKQEAEEAGAQEEGEEAEAGGEAKPEETPSEEQPSASESSSADSGPSGPIASPFQALGGVGFTNRNFIFHDTLTTLVPEQPLSRALRDYKGGLDISLWIRLDLYPAGLLGGQGFLTNVGLTGGYEFGIPSTTVYKNNLNQSLNMKNYAQEWFLGARVRAPLSPQAGLAFVAVYGQQKYILKGDESFALVPDVIYSYFRPALEANMRFGKVTVEAVLGARLILGVGELERPDIWFRNVGGFGVDGALNVAYAITPKFSVFAGGRMIRYGFDFNPIVKDSVWKQAGSIVAGGAVDQYLGGLIGASFRLPDVGGAE